MGGRGEREVDREGEVTQLYLLVTAFCLGVSKP